MTPDLIQARNSALEPMDEEAFDEALEAYWEANGGTYGGVRAAIVTYNALIAAKSDTAQTPIDQRDDEDGSDPVERSMSRGDAQYSTIRDGRA